jgi:Immunoglobulin I-set domain
MKRYLFLAAVLWTSVVAVRALPPQAFNYSPWAELISVRGGRASVIIGVYSDSPAQFQWKFHGTNLPGATNPIASSFSYSYLQLAFANAQPANAGVYTLVATNASGGLSLNVTQRVEPLLFYGPYSQISQSGSEAVLNVDVDSTVPVTYRWRRFGTNFPGTNSFLTFPNMSAADAGDYSVVASNSFGVRTSQVATVILGQYLPEVPYGYHYSLSLLVGAELHLRMDFLWAASNSFQWYFNGTALAGETNLNLFVPLVSTNQAGLYSVTATNDFGLTSSPNWAIDVSTLVPTAFGSTPVSVYEHDTAGLASQIEGGPQPVFQWSFQGLNIPSATNSTLVLSNVTLPQAGNYLVTATNVYGGTTQVVLLTVQPRRALDRWTVRDATTNEDLYGIIFTNGQFVAVGYEGTILTSTNGTNWARQNSGTSRDLHALIYAGGQYVAVGRKGTVLTSPNAVVWTSRTTPSTNYLERIAYGGSNYVIAGTHGTILTSSNAINWVARTHPLAAFDVELEGVAYGLGNFVMVGGYYHYWIYFEDGDPQLNYNVVSALLVSSNGVDWTDQGVDVGVHLRGVTFANGIFLAVGNDGHALYSTNAVDWIPFGFYAPYTFAPNLRHATYGAGRFVVVGNYGTMLSARAPGESFPSHPSGVTENLHDVAYGLGKFIAVGNAGTIIQSAASSPAFATPRALDGAIRLTLSEGLEDSYPLQSTTDFQTWTSAGALTNDGVGASFAFNTNGPRRFYRAVNP